MKQDVHKHEEDVSQLCALVDELETDSPQVLDQLQDTRNRHGNVKDQVDGIVGDLQSAHAEQASYRDMLQVCTNVQVPYTSFLTKVLGGCFASDFMSSYDFFFEKKRECLCQKDSFD